MVQKQTPLTPEQVEQLLGISYDQLPRHVAVIPDGNGRWAKSRGKTRIKGHREGINTVRNLVRESRRLGIGYLTLYAFSNENWNRPQAEVTGLWKLLKAFLRDELPELLLNGVRVKVIGRIERIPPDVQEEIRYALKQTEKNSDLVLTIALSYSGRDELVCAARRFARDVQEGKVDVASLTEESFTSYLDTAGTPDPDLLIRTSGEWRISNYLLWQLAYSEIYIVDKLWPDFDVETYHQAIRDYVGRERRFGRTSEQLNDL